MPLDQGEMASCYVTPTRLRRRARSCASCSPTPTRRSRSWRSSTSPAGAREVRETNYCRIFAAADGHTGKVLVFSAIDNLWKGTSSQAVQNLNVMFGLPEARGLEWRRLGRPRGRSSARAGCPRRRTCASCRGDSGLPAGFRAAGVAAGSSRSGKPDVGLLVCDAERPVSAARFTATGTPAAPVLRQPRALPAARAARGARQLRLRERGDRPARTRRRRQDAGRGGDRRSAWTPPRSRSPRPAGSATYLPVDAVLKGILAGPRGSSPQAGDGDFQQAIQTTDAFEKRAILEVELPSGTVRLSAQCKGAGMISPRFATMLCFVETDAALSAETADLLLGVCVKRSFDRASVDGQLSTNDTAILMCSGASRRDASRRRARTSCASARRSTRCCASSRS